MEECDSKSKREEIEKELLRRKQYESEALATVIKLLETNNKPADFIAAADSLNPGYYKDLVEERSLSNICGYALCDNALKQRKPQKYHISIKHKKVFDLSERNHFCSSNCFKASLFYENQLSKEPLWSRLPMKKPVQLFYHLRDAVMLTDSSIMIDYASLYSKPYDDDTAAVDTDAVIHSLETLKLNKELTTSSNCDTHTDRELPHTDCRKNSSDQDIQGDSTVAVGSVAAAMIRTPSSAQKTYLDDEPTISSSHPERDGRVCSASYGSASLGSPIVHKSSSVASKATVEKDITKSCKRTQSERPSPVQVALLRIQEWKTDKTVALVTSSIDNNSGTTHPPADDDTDDNPESDTADDLSDMITNVRLDSQERRQPLPNIESLGYKLNPIAEKPVDPQEDKETIMIKEPTLKSVRQQQQSIVLRHIKHSADQLRHTLSFDLDPKCMLPFSALVSTFRLTRENIVMSPAEWSMVTLLLLATLTRDEKRSQSKIKLFFTKLLGSDSIIAQVITLLTG